MEPVGQHAPRGRRGRRIIAGLIAAGAALAGGTAPAKESPAAQLAPPPVFKAMLDCRTIKDDAARLACYDKSAAELAAAAQAHEIVVADKAEIREAKKGLFGFALPQVKIFGGHDGVSDVDHLEATIAAARPGGTGWEFTLEDGAVWQQTDTQEIAVDPRPGSKVVIRHGALSSFLARIDGQPAVHVRRVR